jgi:hypothetical protein
MIEELPEITPDTWICIPRWEEFQHYHDRKPVWIKLYVKLLHNPDFLALSSASRGTLMTLWLLYASENGPVRVADAARFGHRSAGYMQLASLNHAGFIELSSRPLLATKKEKEKETPYPLTNNRVTKSPHLGFVCETCAVVKKTQRQLDEHLANVHGAKPIYDLLEDLDPVW